MYWHLLLPPDLRICSNLGEAIDAEKASGRPVKLVGSRIAAKAVKLLFKELAALGSGRDSVL